MDSLLVSLCPVPAAEALCGLRRELEAAFPREESRAYLDGLCGTSDHPLPPRIVAARLGALSLLPSLLDRAGIPSERVRLSRDEHGRPYGALADGEAIPFDFNLSHSDGHVACVLLTGGGRVGIDAEEAIPPKKALPLLRRYGTPGEISGLEGCSDEERAEGFTRIWVVREALCKQDGRGMPLRYDASVIPASLRVLHGRIPQAGTHIAICVPARLCADDVIPVPPCPDIRWQELS